MLHFKDSNKLFEFKDYFNSTTRVISNLISFLDVFSNKSLIRGVFGKKTKGYSYIILLQSLLLLPFLGAKNINNLFNTHYKLFYEGKKDSLYEVLKNPVINWRLLLYRFARHFIKKIKENDINKVKYTCFVADDSDLEKRTPFFEGISRIFNHVIRRHIFGYKLLTLGFYDGKSFLPLDFSLHNEKGKKKNYGLTKRQKQKQFRKNRDKNTNGYKRKKELRINKIDNLIKMVKRSVKHNIIADYLLTDSWFLSEKLITEIRSIKNGAIHLISMVRMDKRNYFYNEKKLNAKNLLKQLKANRKNIKRSKKYRISYIEVVVKYNNEDVKLFFTRLSKRSNWRLLLSTKISLNFTEVYDIYSNRWTIEVFFKESKQNFELGKNQSQDFDSQIASTTISFIQYLMLSLYKRYEKYETIGGAFLESKNQMQEIVLSEKIQFLLIELVKILVIELDLDIEIEKIISKVISNIDIKSKIEDFLPPKAA